MSSNHIVVGRSRDCDFVIDDTTVSGRHARLSWEGKRIHVEDLGSANGTFVGGERIQRATVRPGDDLRLGRADLPWSHKSLRSFLRHGGGDTVEGLTIPGRRFVCGACGTRGVMPVGFAGGVLRCGACAQRLVVSKPERGWGRVALAALALVVVLGAAAWMWRAEQGSLSEAAGRLGLPGSASLASSSPQEASIRSHTLSRVIEALDATSSITRNAAARIAAGDEGSFRVEQVARIWSHAREEWRYVNDPRGGEYFARASETIENGYVGDCDDFAILLTAMITSIGGDARIVMMDGEQGGHAYAEVCLREASEGVRDRLSEHYGGAHSGVRAVPVTSVHYRPGHDCPVWLNLDWNAGVPGGPYENEHWAVGIYPDGRTETLAPSTGPVPPPTVGSPP